MEHDRPASPLHADKFADPVLGLAVEPIMADITLGHEQLDVLASPFFILSEASGVIVDSSPAAFILGPVPSRSTPGIDRKLWRSLVRRPAAKFPTPGRDHLSRICFTSCRPLH